MSQGKRHPLARAHGQARALCSALRPYCERIEIAGSIRRQRRDVGDVEIVLQPQWEHRPIPGQTSFFAPPRTARINLVWAELDRLTARGVLPPTSKGGERMRCYPATGDRLQVDVFCVVDPRSWGVILAIRTGPADFGARCMQRLRNRQLRCEGALVHGYLGEVIPCPEEVDFFRACGLEWIEPQDRR